jgi:hypothetical protein
MIVIKMVQFIVVGRMSKSCKVYPMFFALSVENPFKFNCFHDEYFI